MGRGVLGIALSCVAWIGQAWGAAPPAATPVPDGPWRVRYISRGEALEMVLRRCGLDESGSSSAVVNERLLEAEKAYWRLNEAYCRLYFRELALSSLSEACRLAQLRYEAGQIETPDFSRSRHWFKRYLAERLEAIRTVEEQDRRLRILLGLSRSDNVRLAPDDSPSLPRSDRFRANRARRQALGRELDDLMETYRSGRGRSHSPVVAAQVACTEALSAEYKEIVAHNIHLAERAFARGAILKRARKVIAGGPSSTEGAERSSESWNASEVTVNSGSLTRMLLPLPLPRDPSQLFLATESSADLGAGYFEKSR